MLNSEWRIRIPATPLHAQTADGRRTTGSARPPFKIGPYAPRQVVLASIGKRE